jgi:hypothetical protein
VVLDVLPAFEDLRELLVEDGHAQREHIEVLVEVVVALIVFVVVQSLRGAVVVLGVKVEAVHACEHLVVRVDSRVIIALIEVLAVPEHEFLEEPARVYLLHIVQFGILLGETDVQQMLLEVAGNLQVELALVPVQIDEHNLRTVV